MPPAKNNHKLGGVGHTKAKDKAGRLFSRAGCSPGQLEKSEVTDRVIRRDEQQTRAASKWVPYLSLIKVGEETKAGEKGLGTALDDLAVSSSLR